MFTKLTLKGYVHVCTPDYITTVSWLDAHAPDLKLPPYKINVHVCWERRLSTHGYLLGDYNMY